MSFRGFPEGHEVFLTSSLFLPMRARRRKAGRAARILRCSVCPPHIPADEFHHYHHPGSKQPQQGGHHQHTNRLQENHMIVSQRKKSNSWCLGKCAKHSRNMISFYLI